ncbi:hypothetical protein GGTG_11525 [Gaeumannomyces tritici R3-111a-1]|uniref:Uncharacterized protein n=1 Tax=Gaeumannomyces tritici (strain R3-111a-1) TaxID=644352 RepID=J3PDF4_GAET3|nr:hypothetical protein GGTG_11525 [Gaeumannomyces tritici R3-111a-1]EJT70502.1 hypothetical protein GGTG_11525 [Gaeumannomyces tritici R3-111a-1]
MSPAGSRKKKKSQRSSRSSHSTFHQTDNADTPTEDQPADGSGSVAAAEPHPPIDTSHHGGNTSHNTGGQPGGLGVVTDFSRACGDAGCLADSVAALRARGEPSGGSAAAVAPGGVGDVQLVEEHPVVLLRVARYHAVEDSLPQQGDANVGQAAQEGAPRARREHLPAAVVEQRREVFDGQALERGRGKRPEDGGGAGAVPAAQATVSGLLGERHVKVDALVRAKEGRQADDDAAQLGQQVPASSAPAPAAPLAWSSVQELRSAWAQVGGGTATTSSLVWRPCLCAISSAERAVAGTEKVTDSKR